MLLVAFIVLAPTLRAYVSQQEQLRDVNARLADTNARVETLQDELEQWADPEYIKSQARDRFSYVDPGETVYKVVDPETVTGEDPMAELAAQNEARPAYATASALPWYSTIWGSVEVAGAAQQATAAEEAEAGTPSPDAPATDAPADGTAPAGG
ncbi:FtsB family cell division protein [Serinibacter arcticus]|uniref:FtsB family cell division protein n=1 Tax=Serinibacter arcticus TaxID=1655435 RepID=UPI001304BBF8|nr:septum formation initiator family protein [Serinibacter arcticus]